MMYFAGRFVAGPSLISCQPSWRKTNRFDDGKLSATAEAGSSVLALFFITNPQQPSVVEDSRVGLHKDFLSSRWESPVK